MLQGITKSNSNQSAMKECKAGCKANQSRQVDKSRKGTIKECPEQASYPRVAVHMPKAMPPGEQHQRLYAGGDGGGIL